ncbi:putative outer membrane starch-binding protein [Chitinophaga polysaccharea]|uniref:Putative outer membrane starch-binding protein n=1 Tax=Chitinophaga polysaccharea TaxID=1293035 RepID=A0A561PXR7_9BACT|nr:RagB/SusD family nutrient uptake outer membrane protein [Chitinophaga polysaccharea]TWF42903.1 putative outer membrane starch-binding protein [Chitinophaga polysaccharea]
MSVIKFFFILIVFSGFVACKKSLTEVPLDFYSPENSYNNKAQFESALADIYLKVRTYFYAASDAAANYDMMGYDADFADNLASTNSVVPYFRWNTLNADNGFANKWWGQLYKIIAESNTIINRAELPAAKWASEAEKNAVVGEARFLRAFAYHFLANMWGGVPLVVNETTAPKFDYTRASQDDVYQQCKTDLIFATQWMTGINNQISGRAPREAAFSLLSEISICLKDYAGAVKAADSVILGGNCRLMTSRFGKWSSFSSNAPMYQGAYQPWGDVYFDLFQDGNFNFKEGNQEALWNIEQSSTVIGGNNTDVNASGGFFVMERWWCPNPWRLVDLDGKPNFLQDTLMGRPNGALTATKYADSLIWQYKGDWNNDIRNSKYNIIRTHYWTNPASAYYGQPITRANMKDPSLFRAGCAPTFVKAVSCVHYKKFQDPTSKQWHDNGRTYKDWYIMRLPETYLLRAEAKMRLGDLGGAANDINAIRTRAHATPVTEADVTIDLILDERARELYMEEFRLNTLMRLGKLTEYLSKYNGDVKETGYTPDPKVNKMPIPNPVIQANTGASLAQNPGY